MSTVANRRLLSRLHRDLKELLEQPYPGVTVFTNDANIRRFCLVLTPPSGPFTGMNLHFDVELPLDWVCPLLCHITSVDILNRDVS